MVEKIILTIAITFSLYWVVQTRSQQRAVAVTIDRQVDVVTIARS